MNDNRGINNRDERFFYDDRPVPSVDLKRRVPREEEVKSTRITRFDNNFKISQIEKSYNITRSYLMKSLICRVPPHSGLRYSIDED